MTRSEHAHPEGVVCSRHVFRAVTVLTITLAAAVAAATAAAATTERVSLTATGGEGNAASYGQAVSHDCRYVAFASDASNLVVGDTNGEGDFFLHDRTAQTTIRVDVSSAGAQVNGQPFFDPYSLAISAGGRDVVFGSFASGLVAGDTNGHEDVYLRDTLTGKTVRVSRTPGHRQFHADSYGPAVSADGRYVAWTTSPPTTGRRIWEADRTLGTVRPVSVGRRGNWLPDSQGEQLSADGRYVVIGELTRTSGWQVYLHDMRTRRNTLVSRSIRGGPGHGASESASISADGRYIAYDSRATDLVRNDTNRRMDTFLFDRRTGKTSIVTLTSSGRQVTGPFSGGLSDSTGVSPQGRYVVFSTMLPLDPADTNHRRDVYVRDRGTHTTIRMSLSSTGTQLGREALAPALCAGPSAAFFSADQHVVAADTNNTEDVFLRLGP